MLDVRLPRTWDTAGAALAECARALGDPRSVGELLVASGRAFALWLDARLTPAGPHVYPWREELTVAAERLACEWQLVASTVGEPLFGHAQGRAFALAAAGVRAGRPSLCFGVHLGEFGLVRGLVDEQTLAVSGLLDDAGASSELPRDGLGQEVGQLFLLQLVDRIAVDAREAARASLLAGVRAHDAVAWQRFEAALVSGDLDPLGLAATAARYAEARTLVAQHLPSLGAAAALSVDAALPGYRRCAAMLGELAGLVPYPPGPSFMLTSTVREEAVALVQAAARAEAEAASALAGELELAARAALTDGITLCDLDARTLPDLFACVEEIPIAELPSLAAECRVALAPELGRALSGKLLYDGATLVGHLLWAPLELARYPVVAEGKRWFVYCPWLASARRGAGLGRRLLDALVADARAAGVDGLLTVATAIDVFLPESSYERLGFVECHRAGGTRLMELRLTEAAACARLVEPPRRARGGALPVVVRQAHNCPLLLYVRQQVAASARALEGEAAVDEAPATREEPAGASIGGRALPHGPLGLETIRLGLLEAARQWSSRSS